MSNEVHVDWRVIRKERAHGYEWPELAKQYGVSAVTLQRAVDEKFVGMKTPRPGNSGRKPVAQRPTEPGKHGDKHGPCIYMEWRELVSLREKGLEWGEIALALGWTGSTNVLASQVDRKRDGWVVPRTAASVPTGEKKTKTITQVNKALAKSNGHKPVRVNGGSNGNGNGNGHNGAGDPVLRQAIASLLPTLSEHGVIYVEIDARNRNAKIAQVVTIDLHAH